MQKLNQPHFIIVRSTITTTSMGIEGVDAEKYLVK
jgi:hypothetical protein